MSESSSPASRRFFQPVTLLAGVVLGLLALAWGGRAVTGYNWHRDFVRFHPLIAPEAHYQPTVAEMCAIVRAHCRPDQILVIVGGNSILEGVGQPVEKVWTRRLQELLGERFCVVNLAFRGSSPTDGGAIVAEVLRDEFPRQIYLANVPPFTAASPGGSVDYFFILLDAYYKGWLLELPARRMVIADYLSRPDLYPTAREQALSARLDAILRFRDFWNWFSTTKFFTFPTTLTFEFDRAFRARDKFSDPEPDFEMIPIGKRFREESFPIEMEITRNTTAPFYKKDVAGVWQPVEAAQRGIAKYAHDAFPDRLKPRTLIILSPNAPFYTNQLTPDERIRDEMAFRDSTTQWKALGYDAMQYGPGFTNADFGDRTHLTATGGRKLAERVAPQIRQLVETLGYVKN